MMILLKKIPLIHDFMRGLLNPHLPVSLLEFSTFHS